VRKGRQVRAETVVCCPYCGKRTGLRLGLGDAIVYCRSCQIEIEVSIYAIEKEDHERTREQT